MPSFINWNSFHPSFVRVCFAAPDVEIILSVCLWFTFRVSVGMGNRKRFGKKQSVTFNLVSKSRQDPESLECDNARVWTQETDDRNKRKDELAEYGIYFDDDYDYMQHLRERSAGADLDIDIDDNAPLWDISEEGQFSDGASESKLDRYLVNWTELH